MYHQVKSSQVAFNKNKW